MSQRLPTFGELIQRLAPPLPGDVYQCTPIVASAVAIENPTAGRCRPFWVVMHSLTDREVRLLHAAPIRAKQLSVVIEFESGELLEAKVTATGSQPRGELYETTAEFQRSGLDPSSRA